MRVSGDGDAGPYLEIGNLENDRHRIMGTTMQWGDPQPKQDGGDRPKGSDVYVTHLYKLDGQWTMRIFAFIPRSGNPVDAALRKLLTEVGRLNAEFQHVLTNLPVKVEMYPAAIPSLIGIGKEGCI